MKIFCDCGKLIVEGEIVERKGKKFDVFDKPKGTIIKNDSSNPSNPKEWKGICSECQSKKDKLNKNSKNKII